MGSYLCFSYKMIPETIAFLTMLAIIGIIVGVLTNLKSRLLGSMMFNFILIGAFFWYQYLAEKLKWKQVPLPIMIFFAGYVLGTYGSRLTKLLFGIGA